MASLSNHEDPIVRFDRSLNELDQLARKERSPARFYGELLRQMKLLLPASDCCIVRRLEPEILVTVAATTPSFGGQAEQYLSKSVSQNPAGLPKQWVEQTESAQWFGCSLRGLTWSDGGMVVMFPLATQTRSEKGDVPASHSTISEILSALAEIVCSFQSEQCLFQSNSQSTEMRSIVRSILACNTACEADQVLVEGARCLLDSDRVCLLQSLDKTNSQTMAISGISLVDAKSDVVLALNRLSLTSDINTPRNRQLTDLASETGSAMTIAIPIQKANDLPRSAENESSRNFLVVEWTEMDRYQANAAKIERLLPWLTDAWQGRSRPGSRSVFRTKLLKWTTVLVCLGGGIIYFMSPTELTILSRGTLQPSEQRFVFSPAEGYVDKIYVADGQSVHSGEVVVIVSSPQVQLQVNQITAEIGLVDQKRAGLNITLNQLKPADDPANLTGSRLAGEVQELEARRANLIEQKQLLDREQQRLQLRSPIDGTVIAWEVEKYLENRPVRRGDTLLRIAALDRPWRLESAVADWESGYVIEAFHAMEAENKPLAVEFVLASSPRVPRSGKVLSISNTMLDIGGSQHLEVIVEPDAMLESRRLGTSITVSIPCGQFPRWFVWTRSILDAVHRRFWF